MQKHQQQQKLWRKAANSILSLPYNLALIIAFSLIFLLTIQWLAIESELRSQMQPQTREVALQLVNYSQDELIQAVNDNNAEMAQSLLDKLVNHQLIAGSTLYDQQGITLAESMLDTLPSATQTILFDLSNERNLGTLKLMLDENFFNEQLEHSLNKLTMVSLLLMLGAVFCALLLAKKLTAPVTKLLSYPLNDPDELTVEHLDVKSELKQLLETADSNYSAPAPVSTAEDAGIHHLLATDSVSKLASVISLEISFKNFSSWISPESGTPNIHQLRALDKLLILTIHSQQGHLLNFKGQVAEACFALDGDIDNAPYRAVCCAYLLTELLAELGLECQFTIRQEQRLLIHHQKRTPVAIALEPSTESDIKLNASILIDQHLLSNPILQEQFDCSTTEQQWAVVAAPSANAQTLLARQLSWIRYLLES
jgi:uncharacterized membrane protein affecting hemolysin expression